MTEPNRGRRLTPALHELTPNQVRDAEFVVTYAARDLDDCRTLLDVLGLLQKEATCG